MADGSVINMLFIEDGNCLTVVAALHTETQASRNGKYFYRAIHVLSAKVETDERHLELLWFGLFVVFAFRINEVVGTGRKVKLATVVGKAASGRFFFSSKRRKTKG